MKNYFTARRFGVNVQILLHDLWGIDGYDSVADIPTPGDNGDWTDCNSFLSAIFSIFIENNIIGDVYFDITNEIDNTQYYTRGLDRYLEVWGFTYHRVANEFPQGKSAGPSFGNLPDRDAQDWCSAWTSFTASNQTNASITYDGPFMLNKYGNLDQQVPPGSAWNIAQIERANALGDTYAVVGSDRVRVLAGVRLNTGTWGIVLSGLSAVGLPSSGDLPIRTLRFETGGLYTEVDAPTDLGYYTYYYTDGG
ncbi:unnamed protein product [Penicillium pancosmium]